MDEGLDIYTRFKGIILGIDSQGSQNQSQGFDFDFAEFLASTNSETFIEASKAKLKDESISDEFKSRLTGEIEARGFELEP